MSVEGIPQVNPDLYSDTYYETVNGSRAEAYDQVTDTVSPFHRALFTLLLRAGFLLIQLGSIPIRDTNLILLHNMFELSIATVSYGVVGFIFAYGNDVGQAIGTSRWISSYDANMNDALTGWSAVITATGIFTTMVAGRIHLAGYLVVIVVMAAFVDPVVIHWIWTRDGFMHDSELRDLAVSYRDVAGCAVIHMFAGCVALIAVFALGRRLMRLKDIHETSLPSSAPATCFLGYFLVIVGLIALCMPNTFYQEYREPDNYVGRILVDNILAMAGGILSVCLIQFAMEKDRFDYWTMLRCMQGAIAGIVIISAGPDCYTPIVALLLGMAAGTVYYFVARGLFSSPLEDYCNIVAIHFVCGLIGTLLPPIFGDTPGFAFDSNSALRVVVLNVCWQAFCDGILLLVFFLVFVPLFLLLYVIGFVHNLSDELDHRRAQTVLARGPDRSLMRRLFKPGDAPRLITPGNKPKDEARQRDLLDADSKVNSAYYDPRSGGYPSYVSMKPDPGQRKPPLQTYRVEVETSRPPLADYYTGNLQDGDYARESFKTSSKEQPKDTDVKISMDGIDIENDNIQNVPYGEPAWLYSSKYNLAQNELVRPDGDNIAFAHDIWQMRSQPAGIRSLDSDLNILRKTDKDIDKNVQAFSHHDNLRTGHVSQVAESGHTFHDIKTLHRQYLVDTGEDGTQNVQNVSFGNTSNRDHSMYENDETRSDSGHVVTECRIQIDDDTHIDDGVRDEDICHTVYISDDIETPSAENILNNGCISANFGYKNETRSQENVSSGDNLLNAASDIGSSFTESSSMLIETRNQQKFSSVSFNQGEYILDQESSQTSQEYRQYAYSPSSNYTVDGQNFNTAFSEYEIGHYLDLKKTDDIQDLSISHRSRSNVNTTTSSGGRFTTSGLTAGHDGYGGPLRHFSDSALSAGGFGYAGLEAAEPTDGEQRRVEPRSARSLTDDEAVSRGAAAKLGAVPRKASTKRPVRALNATAKRACKKRDKYDVQVSLRARSVAKKVAGEDGATSNSYEENITRSRLSESLDDLNATGPSTTRGNQRPVPPRPKEKYFKSVIDELTAKLSRSPVGDLSGPRPSPSRPYFTHNLETVRAQHSDVGARRDVMAVQGQASEATRGVRRSPMRVARDNNGDVVLDIDPDEEEQEERLFQDLDKWFN